MENEWEGDFVLKMFVQRIRRYCCRDRAGLTSSPALPPQIDVGNAFSFWIFSPISHFSFLFVDKFCCRSPFFDEASVITLDHNSSTSFFLFCSLPPLSQGQNRSVLSISSIHVYALGLVAHYFTEHTVFSPFSFLLTSSFS